ncbi:hypothetical protein MKK84_14485 [Methylobacterium sp. E-065]|uniref:hypothetical protein n=1 Tax=Methylobacterium sp. E-065 TaxID=2836583 RepID=UPI001FBBC352|nr:hypothetical protein [Methylobacterium sp. E-065]MCJ2018630.1 hypothetical protein [Methylobacterium sp. E-065]
MSAPGSRRGFLRGLTTLPLIGGGVVLTGEPTASATPITPGLLATYSAWLAYERTLLHHASLESRSEFIPAMNPALSFHFPRRGELFADDACMVSGRRAQERAAIVLAAAGCTLTSPDAEEQWRDIFRPAPGGTL